MKQTFPLCGREEEEKGQADAVNSYLNEPKEKKGEEGCFVPVHCKDGKKKKKGDGRARKPCVIAIFLEREKRKRGGRRSFPGCKGSARRTREKREKKGKEEGTFDESGMRFFRWARERGKKRKKQGKGFLRSAFARMSEKEKKGKRGKAGGRGRFVPRFTFNAREKGEGTGGTLLRPIEAGGPPIVRGGGKKKKRKTGQHQQARWENSRARGKKGKKG